MSQVDLIQDSSLLSNITSLYIPTIIEIVSRRESVLIVFANGPSVLFKMRHLAFYADFEVSAVPGIFSGDIGGLLGNFNGNINDEYTQPNGVVHQNAIDQEINDFGLSCKFSKDKFARKVCNKHFCRACNT